MSQSALAPVSVIVPCHNYGLYVRDAIVSVSRQTQPPAELVVVDDGSTDNSLAVVKALAREIDDCPVRVLTQENQGVAVARNRGAAEALGEFLFFLDADDWLLPQALELTLPALVQDPKAAIAYGHAIFHYSDMAPYPDGPREGEAAAVRDFSFGDLLENNFIFSESLVRRSAFEEAEGFDPRVPVAEDWELWIDICKRGWHGVLVDQPLFVYRLHPGSRRDARDRAVLESMAQIQSIHPELFDSQRREWLAVAAHGEGVRDAQERAAGVLQQVCRSGGGDDPRRRLDEALKESERSIAEWRETVETPASKRVAQLGGRLVEGFARRSDLLRTASTTPDTASEILKEQMPAIEREISRAFQDFAQLGVEIGELSQETDSRKGAF